MRPVADIWLFCLGVIVGGSIVSYVARTSAPAVHVQPPQIASGDITNLIARLKPLAEYPEDDWRGVRVTFTGASAEVKVSIKGGNEYTGKGKTLAAAVTMIDSTRVREALSGWTPQ